MLPDQVSNPGPLTNESGTLPIALHGPARLRELTPDTMCEVSCLQTLLTHHNEKLRINLSNDR